MNPSDSPGADESGTAPSHKWFRAASVTSKLRPVPVPGVKTKCVPSLARNLELVRVQSGVHAPSVAAGARRGVVGDDVGALLGDELVPHDGGERRRIHAQR